MSPQLARPRGSGAAVALLAAVLLVVLAGALPPLAGWNVHPLMHGGVAPLVATWRARIGWGTAPAVVLGAAAVRLGPRLALTLPFGRLLAVGYLAALAWLVSLATVDGSAGIGGVLGREYLTSARAVTNVGATLRHFVEHVPLDSAHNWPTHVAGHPPGALLFFVLLVRLGLGSGLAAGWVVVLLAATTPLAVLVTLRHLGAELAARRVAPFLVVGPAAIWSAVSADALFAAAGAWGLACLARAATSPPGTVRPAAGLAAGLILGWCVMLSYGLPLVGLVGAGVLIVARSPRPVPWVLGGVAAVVFGFAAAGFEWWAALPVLHQRYYAGIASIRPAAYWVWADLAVLCISAGPVLPAALGVLRRPTSEQTRAAVILPLSAAGAVLLADLSLMSKAEVERIWLPFVPWLLVATALLAERWRRTGLAAQVVLALAVQSLLLTRW